MGPLRGDAVNLVVSVEPSHELRQLLERIEHQLAQLTKELKNMANELDTVIADLNANTNTVATRIDNLIAALSAAGTAPTPEQLAELGAISSHLKALGSDPANPVPSPAPPVSQRAATIPPAVAQVTAPASSSDTPTGEMPPIKPSAA